MKLGPATILVTKPGLDWARKAPIVKAIDRIDALQAAPDSAIRIFRQSYANEMDTSDPKGTVNKIVAGLKGYWHPNLYVQIWTGAHPTLVQLQTAVLLCHMNNLKTVGSSWFTGDYTQQDWMDALDASVDAFAPQCYWGNQGFTKDHALRYRQFWKPGQPPVMILECGRDAVEGGKGGWQKDGVSPQAYADELGDYATALEADSYVLGATPFTNGPTPDWKSFDMDPISPLLTGGNVPTPKGVKMTAGIDVSNHQGVIDWPLVSRSAIEFAFIKASEGADYTDKFFTANWKAARDNGLVRGAYHFGRPSQASGHHEADFFLSIVDDIQQGDLLCLDLEDDAVDPHADLLAYTLDFLKTVESEVGFKPLLYSGHYYLSAHNCEGSAELGQYGLWLASYQTNPPPAPNGWPFIALWQHSDAGHVPGIGKCDVDLFNGPLDQLRRYGKQ